MVRATGYVQGIEDLERIPVMATKDGTPVLLRDVAEVRVGPEMRRGIGELDGEGEAVGGVIVMRNGENARDTIHARQGEARGTRQEPARGRRDRGDLRPRGADPACGGQPESQADRRVHRRRAGVLRVPLSHPLRPDRRDRDAHRGAVGLHRHVPAGHQRQHHVAGRHRHRHRHAGGRGDRHDRERAPQAGARRAGREAAARGDLRGLPRGGAVAVLLADDRGAVVPAGVRARGAGRADVRAARVHQDLRDGVGVGAVDHAGAGADLLAGARQHPPGDRQSGQPRDHGGLPAVPRAGAARPVGRDGWRPSCWSPRRCGPRRSSAASSCRSSTRATCCTCRRPCPGCRRTRPAPSCSRPTS